ncbi:hypothetical protein QIS74_10182 [Colletotrichum tabaci]|uniref:Secondary metabolism regulator LAE1 n=1 Tax=Colletotrichum tabaci TaxID=1209068 RepID=A0AAV9T2Q0_9PEZI
MAEPRPTTKSPSRSPTRSPRTGTQEAASSPAGNSPPQDIEAQDEGDEGDGYETSSDTSSNATASLASSIRDYNFENKRRYHKFKEGRYALPNDDAEQEREDMKHAMIVTLCGGALHNAPLENPQNILDIGTGTGIWAIDMGDEYPEAEVTGIDLSPIQPAYVPVNVSFIIDDAEAEWLYPDNSIDYIHIRHMGPAIKNWTKLFAQAFRALKPGGWIEIQELKFDFCCDDDTMPPTYALSKMVHDVKKVPVGEWPKRHDLRKIGAYCKAVIYDGLHAVTIGPYTRGLGWAAEEVEVFLIDVRKDLLNTSIHSYMFYHSLAGQKPLETEEST